eukprot:15246640-Ditylum_brightwellii.AAC.1
MDNPHSIMALYLKNQWSILAIPATPRPPQEETQPILMVETQTPLLMLNHHSGSSLPGPIICPAIQPAHNLLDLHEISLALPSNQSQIGNMDTNLLKNL